LSRKKADFYTWDFSRNMATLFFVSKILILTVL
jgi:hypothetical protein